MPLNITNPYLKQKFAAQAESQSQKRLEARFKAAGAEARSANEARQGRIESIFDEVIARYGPGGSFGKSYLQQLGAQKTRDVGAETQGMISSGLYGTTTTAGIPGKWEAEVGAPARLKLEDLMMERLSSAQLGKASFLERIQEPYPDYSALTQASAAGAGSGGQSMISGGSGLPTNYNPLNDPARHFNRQDASGSVQGGTGGTGGGTTPTGGGGGGGGSSLPSLSEGQLAAFRQNEATQQARDKPGTAVETTDEDGNRVQYVFENGIMRVMRWHPTKGYWYRAK